MMSQAEEAFQAELRKAAWEIGWLRAKFDYARNGFPAPMHYPEDTPEYKGYMAYVRMIREARNRGSKE